MKTIACLFFSILTVCATLPSIGAQEKPRSGMLYQVTGKGITKPSHIFGTFHAICHGDMVALEGLDTFLNQSDQLMMEIDMDDPIEMASMGKAIVMPDGKTIKDFLTAEQFTKVDKMVKNLLGYSADNLQVIKP